MENVTIPDSATPRIVQHAVHGLSSEASEYIHDSCSAEYLVTRYKIYITVTFCFFDST